MLRGEITRGRLTGYHAEHCADGAARIKPGADIRYHDNGVYEDKVKIWNQNSKISRNTRFESSFFPADWSVARIKYEVIEALKVHKLSADQPALWTGESPSGITIAGYIRDHVITFYPLGK